MKALLHLSLILFCTLCIQAQEVYVCDEDGSIYTLDLSDCSTSFIVDLNNNLEPNDITFHPNGNLYGIGSNGKIYEINITTGITTELVELTSSQQFNSLTSDENGLFYATGNQGDLWTYDLVTGMEVNLGNFNFEATGDLTFFEGNLYAATEDDNIALIDLNDISNSAIVIDGDVTSKIFGIVSFSENCNDFNTFANASNGDLYLIDFDSSELNFICTVDLSIYGGASTSEFLASSAPIFIDSINLINPSCSTSGTIEINASGGTAPIEFSINGGAFQTTGVFTDLDAGIYEIAIKDEVDCTVLDTINLEIPNLPVFDNIAIEAPDCGIGNFNIEVMATGSDLEFSINGGTFQASNVFINLDVGTYEIAIKDSIDCILLDTIDLEIPDLPFFNEIVIDTPSCGVDSFNIEILATGNGLSYTLNSGTFQPENTFLGLDEGIYEVAINDENNCTVLDTITLEIPALPSFDDILIETPDCGIGGFSIEILATGNNLIYAIADGFFQSSNTFSNLDAGSYEVAIADENNCVILDTIVLMEMDLPVIDNVNLSFPLCTGGFYEVSILASGGIGSLSYSLDGVNFENGNLFFIDSLGNYTAYVQDSLLCEMTMDFSLVNTPSFVFGDFFIEPTICNENNGSFSIDVDGIIGGTSPYQFSIDNGNTYQTDNLFEGLASGEYNLILKDANDCLHEENFTIPQSEALMAQSESLDASCEMANGSIIVMPQNGTSQMTYSLDGGAPQNENQFDELVSGTYSILATDEQNCTVTIEAIVLEKEAVIIDLLNVENTDCAKENGFIQVEAMFGNPPYEYALDEIDFQNAAVFNNLAEGIYNITVQDALGCQAVLTDVNILSTDCQVIIPDAFSPNGDGLNDVLRAIIPADIDATIKTFNVYNRWGLLLYQSSNVEANSIQASWDGTYKNKIQEIGVYLYYIELDYADGSNEVLKGNVTLIR